MGRFFVEPETVRLELKKCESWIEIKKELNKQEHDTVIGAGIASFRQDESGDTDYRLAAAAVDIVKMQTWIVDWGFTDIKDKSMPVGRKAIENLTVDVAAEVLEAIEAHQKKLDEEKKRPISARRPKAI